MTPPSKTVTVTSGSIVVEQPFIVVGFSISGKVIVPFYSVNHAGFGPQR